MFESSLARPVAEWFAGRGLAAFGEVPCFGRRVDLFGMPWPAADRSRAVAVELKLRLCEAVIEQAEPLRVVVPSVYAAVAGRPVSRGGRGWPIFTVCRRAGVGLLVVDGLGVYEALRPGPDISTDRGLAWRGVVAHCRREGPSTVAGVPSRAGEGPAQRAARAVAAVVRRMPEADWPELHRLVGGGYRSWRSMQRSVGRVDPRLDLPLFRGLPMNACDRHHGIRGVPADEVLGP